MTNRSRAHPHRRTEWGIGGSNGAGLLLVMAVQDDDYWLTPGKGLQDNITAGALGDLVDEYLEPYFADKDYDGGAKALFDALFVEVVAV